MRRWAMMAALAPLAGCGWFASAPSKSQVYDAIQSHEGKPFGVDGVACTPAGEAFDCGFDVTIITGYETTGVADRRPNYQRVRMTGSFSRAGESWRAAGLKVTTDKPTTN